MKNLRLRKLRVPRVAILFALLIARVPAVAQSQAIASSTVVSSGQALQLTLKQIVQNLERRNAERTAALQQFEGKRIYRMEYRGLPSDREAEMEVNVTFHAPDSKEFTVVSSTGSKFIIDHVFKRLLETEQAAARGTDRHQTALTTENYDFALAGFETTPNGGQYVLTLLPRTNNKLLYRGQIWVDARDFAVVRIEGEPSKNPSFWIKKTDIAHRYVKVNDFWLPAENHTESLIRLGGKATLSIEYQDYKILKSTPLNGAENAHDLSVRETVNMGKTSTPEHP